MRGRVLIVAGSDSGGGAGIQADIKSVTALGGFAMTAITALTAQNTEGVHGVLPIPTAFIRQQMEVVLADLGADALKTGMLHDSPTIEAVCDALPPGIPLVADPVMVAKGGHPLLQPDAVETLKRRLIPRATLITPNLPEAEVLTGLRITTEEEMQAAMPALLALGAGAVLLKGGHLEGPVLVDLLGTPDGVIRFEDARIETRHTHGTGCTLASAIAAGLAQGLSLAEAVARARRYVRAAILAAPGFGRGHGPLNHAVTLGPAPIA
ncbi:bifunctional hydroxymethylpyrimidine kinase/phosphomethylpyrimidine kinase [Belnapia sp. F-4-1]|uniref:bifunctional hydroxymethylpyrimidine kinase/phosphomethylpyrimidine kinase n=1 Tax=Belnapia sp. F-4-1 TaxID=1545443 RepID=UPI0005BD442E|nr:bifunctional hydroxymethylpyrimidine kinase/phosphomethylpyrimidine kinase [Belnapia sp. F-4-1]